MSFPGTCESAIATQHLLASDSVDREMSSIILGDLDWAVAVRGQMFKPLPYTVIVLVPCHLPDIYLRAAND